MRLLVTQSTFLADQQRIRLPQVSHEPLLMARGHALGHKPTELWISPWAGGGSSVVGADPARGLFAQLWPPYMGELEHAGERFLVWAAAGESDIMAAKALIDSVHPCGVARQGMFLCLRSLDEPDGQEGLVGAAQIGEYYHVTYPQRQVFGQRLIGPGFSELGRGAAINAIPIAAGKRFAVRADRQGEGLGGLLARQVMEVAADFRWPPARVVEVGRWVDEDKYFRLCSLEADDFLTSSGYVPVAPEKWIRQGRLDAARAAELTPRPIAGYYYADLSERRRAVALDLARGA